MSASVWMRVKCSVVCASVLDELEFENGQTVEDALEGHFKGVLSGDLRKGLKTLGKLLYVCLKGVLMCVCSVWNNQ